MSTERKQHEEVRFFMDQASAEALAGRLRAEGVAAQVESRSPIPGLHDGFRVMVPSHRLEHAREIADADPPSDAELEQLASVVPESAEPLAPVHRSGGLKRGTNIGLILVAVLSLAAFSKYVRSFGISYGAVDRYLWEAALPALVLLGALWFLGRGPGPLRTAAALAGIPAMYFWLQTMAWWWRGFPV